MNLKSYLLSLFRRPSINGEITEAHSAGQRDADILVNAYADGFESRAAEIFLERQNRFLGLPGDEIDAEYEVHEKLTAKDLRGLRKAELLHLAASRGVQADESWTVKRLQETLVEE